MGAGAKDFLESGTAEKSLDRWYDSILLAKRKKKKHYFH